MSIQKNKQIVRRLFEIVRSHDLALLDEVCNVAEPDRWALAVQYWTVGGADGRRADF